MLFVLSPAKKLDYDKPLPLVSPTQPLFVPQAQALIEVLREKSVEQVAALMDLSPSLAELNVQRYMNWSPESTLDNARPALFAFNGDVYEGLDAHSLSPLAIEYAQAHGVILSGLYGALRPLDLLQPYRLEMGTKLATSKGKTLYAYWGSQIADYLNQRLAESGSQLLINLASEEYFKAVDRKTLKAKVVQCVFQDEKNGRYKVISFYAKKARGLMARFIVNERIKHIDALKAFNAQGYAFVPSLSNEDTLVFQRSEQG